MSQDELVQAILNEFGVSGDTFIVGVLPKWFSIYADKGSLWLQYLYVKKRVLTYLIFKASRKVDVTIGGDSIKRSQNANSLTNLLKLLNDEILAEDPGAGVPYLVTASPYSDLPDAMEDFLDQYVEGCWTGKF